MGTCSYIATSLDSHFIHDVRGVPILVPLIAGAPMPAARPGTDVAEELAGRLLVRILTTHQVGTFTAGSSRETYVSPTPYTPEEAGYGLSLPAPLEPRTHVMFLDPARISLIIGPMWVAWGRGIQYILPMVFRRMPSWYQGRHQDTGKLPSRSGAYWYDRVWNHGRG